MAAAVTLKWHKLAIVQIQQRAQMGIFKHSFKNSESRISRRSVRQTLLQRSDKNEPHLNRMRVQRRSSLIDGPVLDNFDLDKCSERERSFHFVGDHFRYGQRRRCAGRRSISTMQDSFGNVSTSADVEHEIVNEVACLSRGQRKMI
jgi:hypothetical protein